MSKTRRRREMGHSQACPSWPDGTALIFLSFVFEFRLPLDQNEGVVNRQICGLRH
jgi:hypothetical protein